MNLIEKNIAQINQELNSEIIKSQLIDSLSVLKEKSKNQESKYMQCLRTIANLSDNQSEATTRFSDSGKYSESRNSNTHYFNQIITSEYGIFSFAETEMRIKNEKPYFDFLGKYKFNQSPKGLIEQYFQYGDKYITHYDSYKRDIFEIAGNFAKVNDDLEYAIIIPSYQEEKGILTTLENLNEPLNKKGAIYLFENLVKGTNRDATRAEINKFRERFPHANIFHSYKEFDSRVPIGMIRKFASDITLAHLFLSDIKNNAVLFSGDADVIHITKGFFKTTVKKFKRNANLDAVELKMDRPREYQLKYVNFFVIQRLFDYMWKYMRYKINVNNAIRSYGPSTAVKTSSFVMIKGYNPRTKLCEDLQISWILDQARRESLKEKDSKKIKYFEFCNESITVNPRREISAYLSNIRFTNMYEGYEEKEEIRNIDWKELLSRGDGKLDKNLIEKEINAIINYWIQKIRHKLITEKDFRKMFSRSLEFLGIEYELQEDFTFKITSMEKLGKKIRKLS